MKTRCLLILFFLCFTQCEAQTHYLPLSDFKFNGISGQYHDDTTTVYSLLCTGMPNNSVNTDSLINIWLTNHSDATLRPVCSFSYYNNSGNRVTFTYSWIVSNAKTEPSLNIYLVRNGSCNTNTMLWAKSPAALKPTIDYYKKMNSETKMFIDASVYKNFVHELKKAQAYAIKHKTNKYH